MTLKVTISFMFALTFLKTPNIRVNFVVGLTYLITRKGPRVIRGHRHLLYDPKYDGYLIGRFDLVYDRKRSQGH